MKPKHKSINKSTRFIYCKDRCMKSSKTSAYIYQTTRCHNPKYRSPNFIHTCFCGINSSNDSRTSRNNSGRTAAIPNSWNTLYKFWDVTNKTPLRVNRGPCHFFRPTSISSLRTIRKPPVIEYQSLFQDGGNCKRWPCSQPHSHYY